MLLYYKDINMLKEKDGKDMPYKHKSKESEVTNHIKIRQKRLHPRNVLQI